MGASIYDDRREPVGVSRPGKRASCMRKKARAVPFHREAEKAAYQTAVKVMASSAAEPFEGALPEPHAAQRSFLGLPGRFLVAACARKFGKTFLGVWMVKELFRRLQNARALWVVPTVGGFAEVMEFCVEVLKASTRKNQQFAWWLDRSRACLWYLPTMGRLRFASAFNEDALRPLAMDGLDLAVVDEAADVAESAWDKVLLPMLLLRDGKAVLLGVPRGQANWLYRKYLAGQRAGTQWSSLRAPATANPLVTKEAVESLRSEMSDAAFRQEVLAEFLVDGSSAFPGFVDLCKGEWWPNGKGPKGTDQRQAPLVFAGGVDFGRSHDWSVISALAWDDRKFVGFERFHGKPWNEQILLFVDFILRFPGVYMVDATGVGDALYEALRSAVLSAWAHPPAGFPAGHGYRPATCRPFVVPINFCGGR